MKVRYTNLSSIEPAEHLPLEMYYADEVRQLAGKALDRIDCTHHMQCPQMFFPADTRPCTCGLSPLIAELKSIVGNSR